MTTITRLLLFATTLLFSNFNFAQTRHYVNPAATGAGDGSSWGDAYLKLQDALLAATYGDEIWVAQGTYLPSTGTNRNISFTLKNGIKLFGGFSGTESSLTERDWANNLTILSGDIGVPGDSTDNAYNVVYCNAADSTTVLDGFTITYGNADSQASGPTTLRPKSGGGLHMVGSFQADDTRPVIANCTFTRNYARFNGGGIFLRTVLGVGATPTIINCSFQNNGAANGAGIYKEGSSSKYEMLIEGCVFTANSAANGGGIFFGNNDGTKNLEVTQCSFFENYALTNGGGISQEIENTDARLNIKDCTFQENKSDGEGGAISNYNFVYSEGLTIDHCDFVANYTSATGTVMLAGDGLTLMRNATFVSNVVSNSTQYSYGGCIYIVSKLEAYNCLFLKNMAGYGSVAALAPFFSLFPSSAKFINCTFVSNTSPEGLIFSSAPEAEIAVFNSIMYDNNLTANDKLLSLDNAGLTISYSLVDVADCSSIADSPITCGPNMLYNLDPQFLDPDNGDFHLLSTSPAINAGDNAIVDSLGILTDIEGSPRIQGGIVDMGAYESAIAANSGVKYVNVNVQGGNNDGTSWANAYLKLQDALLAATYGDTIWVAEGTYFPTQSGDRNIYFELKNGVKLLGGFAGIETQLSERDWAAHPTVLSGDIGISGDSTDNSYTVLYIGTSDTTTLADGMTIVYGNANGQAVFDRNPLRAGGGLYIMGENSYAYPRIWNCRFEHNYALKLGGAAYVNGVNGSVAPQFFNCVFESNHAGVDGGAIRRDGGSWVEIKNDFWNCTFINNSAMENGGAILYRDTERLDTTEYVGCTFLKNNAGNLGGAVCQLEGRETGNKVVVTDCVFQENLAEKGGGYCFINTNFMYSDFFRFIGCTFSKNHSLTSSSACHIDAFFFG